jgi:hypothetical protein
MSDNLNPILEQALRELLSNLTEAKQFILAQAPDVLQQIIYKQIVSAIFIDILATIFTAITCAITWWFAKRDDDDLDPAIMLVGMIWCTALGFGIVGMVETYNALIAYFAPKVYLIEYIANLIGK